MVGCRGSRIGVCLSWWAAPSPSRPSLLLPPLQLCHPPWSSAYWSHTELRPQSSAYFSCPSNVVTTFLLEVELAELVKSWLVWSRWLRISRDGFEGLLVLGPSSGRRPAPPVAAYHPSHPHTPSCCDAPLKNSDARHQKHAGRHQCHNHHLHGHSPSHQMHVATEMDPGTTADFWRHLCLPKSLEVESHYITLVFLISPDATNWGVLDRRYII